MLIGNGKNMRPCDEGSTMKSFCCLARMAGTDGRRASFVVPSVGCILKWLLPVILCAQMRALEKSYPHKRRTRCDPETHHTKTSDAIPFKTISPSERTQTRLPKRNASDLSLVVLLGNRKWKWNDFGFEDWA
jgi:hypothetical protein